MDTHLPDVTAQHSARNTIAPTAQTISQPYVGNPILTDSSTEHCRKAEDGPVLNQKDAEGQQANVERVDQGDKVVRPTIAAEIHPETTHELKRFPNHIMQCSSTPMVPASQLQH